MDQDQTSKVRGGGRHNRVLYKPQLQMQTSPAFPIACAPVFWAGKADSEPRWTRSAAASAKSSIQIPNEERPDGSRLRALPCAAPRGKSIVKPCAKPAPKHCQESAQSSHSLPINVDWGHPGPAGTRDSP